MNPAGEFHGPIEGSVGDHQAVYAAALEMSSHKVTHLARADEHHRFIVETVKDPFGQIDRHRADRDRSTGNSRLVPDSLGNGK
jgi:hypothetical protein